MSNIVLRKQLDYFIWSVACCSSNSYPDALIEINIIVLSCRRVITTLVQFNKVKRPISCEPLNTYAKYKPKVNINNKPLNNPLNSIDEARTSNFMVLILATDMKFAC